MQTNKNLLSASKELNGARPLRCYIDTILKQIIDDLKSQKIATDNAFRNRIDEIKEAKTRLELQHSEVFFLTSCFEFNLIKHKKLIYFIEFSDVWNSQQKVYFIPSEFQYYAI